MTRKKVLMLLGSVCLALMLALPLVACPAPTPTPEPEEVLEPITLIWTAGTMGGGWYAQAGGVAALIKEHVPEITIKVVPGGGTLNPARIGSGEANMGWGMTAMNALGFIGEPPYDVAYPSLRSLGAPFGLYHQHFVAVKDLGLTKATEVMELVKQGEAINIATSTAGTTSNLFCRMVFEYYGLSMEDIEAAGGKVFYGGHAEQTTWWKDRHIDLFFANISYPAAAVMECALARDLTLLSFSDEFIADFKEKGGLPKKFCVIPAGQYEGVDIDVPAVAISGELTINKDVPDIVAYTIVKVLCENLESLHTIHKAMETFIPEAGWEGVGVPLHPGAERYYREMGYLK